jgi:uncharacterized protein (TIGR02145 family)
MKKNLLLLLLVLVGFVKTNGQTIMNIHLNDGNVIQVPLNTIDSITYTFTSSGNLASVFTLPVVNITANSAISGGNITNTGASAIIQSGVVWSTFPSPSISDNLTNEEASIGTFTSNLTGLNPNTTYYVRAYAVNNEGTFYGNQFAFTTASLVDSIVSNPGEGISFDGYSYSTIVLGNNQEWMAENLRTHVYANGDSIPNVIPNEEWMNLTTGAWSHYNNDSQFESPYGKLYNWYAVNDSRQLCPIGWHVPSNNDWNELYDYLGGEAVAGGKMKAIGTQFWNSPNIGASNESNFNGVAGGVRNHLGQFGAMGESGGWWVAEEVDADWALFEFLLKDGIYVQDNGSLKVDGISVRCLKD